MKYRGIHRLGMLVLLLSVLPFSVRAEETGGIHILKTNASGQVLSDARFYVAREASAEEKQDPGCVKETFKIGQKELELVYESFLSGEGADSARVWQVETDSSGKAEIYGLSYGTHYLIEAKAPEGYNRITQPIRITVNRYSHLTESDGITDEEGVILDNTIHIINVRYRIPDTGRLERLCLVMAGFGIVSASAALWLMGRRRK